MQRREFITLLGGAAIWPFVARAQQDGRNRRIGVLMPYLNRDALGQARLAAFTEELQQLSWTDGRNLQIAVRWAERSISLLSAEFLLTSANGTKVVCHLVQVTAAFERRPDSRLPEDLSAF
jgi:hypothetical protein